MAAIQRVGFVLSRGNIDGTYKVRVWVTGEDIAESQFSDYDRLSWTEAMDVIYANAECYRPGYGATPYGTQLDVWSQFG